jgi:hypothetical protein
VRLTIDNLDGLGAVDYSGSIDRSSSVRLERALNVPSTFAWTLCLENSGLKPPVRQGRVVVVSEAAGEPVLFTGYLAVEPVAVYTGTACEGSVYRLACRAVSDEWLLDKQTAGSLRVGNALGVPSGALLQSLINRVDSGRFPVTGSGNSVGVFTSAADGVWSAQAGNAANAGFGSYRVLGGALTLSSMPGTLHTLADGNGSLTPGALSISTVRELANDVTVSGAEEPNAYWTELFAGDGTTTAFVLTGEPASADAGKATLLSDPFTGTALNRGTWSLTDPGSHMSLGAGGLLLNGGNGLDGQTVLLANDAVELGGTLVLEMTDVVLNAASAGILGGFFSGPTEQANCTAGFGISQANGNTVLTPLVNGTAAGTPFAVVAGRAYALRIRLHCAEMLRAKQVFYALNGSSFAAFGGGLVNAPLSLVFEIRDNTLSSNTEVSVLYDGSMATSPAQVSFAPVDSVQLFGSLGAISLTRTGSAWVQVTDSQTGITATKLLGQASDGVDCHLSTGVNSTVTFYALREPAAGERVTILYRGRDRAIARLADANSIATEAAGGAVGTSRWVGQVLSPVARASEDCENAALAILSFAANRAAATSGSYNVVNPVTVDGGSGDIWPGDLLALPANGSSTSSTNVLIRRVAVEENGAAPEALTYSLAFANDWAEGLGIKLGETIAADANLPAVALDIVSANGTGTLPAVPAHALANLQSLAVTALTSNSLTVDAGCTAPAGGGFEVRRSDRGFGTDLAAGAGGSASGELVLRSPVRGFTIPRAAFEERFFVRMYDASTPPLYSRVSAAIVTHNPVS